MAMDFESSKKCAERLGVSVRAIQKWAKEGKISGAEKIGREWMIPIDFNGYQQTEIKRLTSFMPFTSGNFEPGRALDYINNISDPEERDTALGEYFYYTGEFEKSSEVLEPYLDSDNVTVRLTAALICTFSNLSMKHMHLVHHCALIIKRDWEEISSKKDVTNELRAIATLCATTLKAQLHISDSILLKMEDYIKYLPKGLKLFGFFITAYNAYLSKNYEYSLGIADAVLISFKDMYSISTAYLHIIAAVDLINLMRTEEAKARIEKAHTLISPDNLLMPLVEHHSMLQGTVEAYYKHEHPETYKNIMEIAKHYNTAWYKIYNEKSGKFVAENLTPAEFTVAMLYSRKWRIKEIADHLKISERTVKNYLQIIYEKLYINNRKDLEKYILS